MISDTPTKDYVAEQIKNGRWPAAQGEAIDIKSLSDREFRVIQMCLLENMLVELKEINTKLTPKRGK